MHILIQGELEVCKDGERLGFLSEGVNNALIPQPDSDMLCCPITLECYALTGVVVMSVASGVLRGGPAAEQQHGRGGAEPGHPGVHGLHHLLHTDQRDQ